MSCKHTFFTGQPIFAQLLKLIPREIVSILSRKHNSDHYCKSFKSYDHLVTMLYQGFFQCLSLREITTGMQANAERIRHLGLTHTPRRSTLSDANGRRPPQFFADIYDAIYHLYHKSLPDSRYTERKLFIIDSTTFALFCTVMKGAGSPKKDGRRKGGAKAHVLLDAQHDLPCFIHITESRHHDLVFLKEAKVPPGSIVVFDRAYTNYHQFNQWNKEDTIWVTRQKNDASYVIEDDFLLSEEAKQAGVICDQLITMGRNSNRNSTPLVKARRIVYKDAVTSKEFVFITNSMSLQPEDIAEIYKKRWQIELLFKRVKQRYPLKYFLGDNANAIQIQIWSMFICDLLVQIVMQQVNIRRKKAWSYANLSSMIKHHLMTYIQLFKFLQNPEKALLNYKMPIIEKGTLF